MSVQLTPPALYFDNRLADGPLQAASTQPGYDVQNLIDWRPATTWRPTTLPASVWVDTAAKAWEFTNSLDGWTGINATLTARPTYLEIKATTIDPVIESAIFTDGDIDGRKHRYVVARLRRNSTTGIPQSSWQGRCYYRTGLHAFSNDYFLRIPDPAPGVQDQWFIAIWDMWSLDAGGDDWKNTPNISRLRLDFANLANEVFDVDWIIAAAELSADYIAMWAHDLKESGVTVKVGGSWDDQVYDVLADFSPPSDKPFVREFTSAQYRWWSFECNPNNVSVPPFIGIAALGNRLEIPAELRSPFDVLGRAPVGQFSRSVAGYPLTRLVNYQQWREDMRFEFVTWEWLRDTWEPAWTRHLAGAPFLFRWNKTAYPDELHLLSIERDYRGPQRSGQWGELRFPAAGLVSS